VATIKRTGSVSARSLVYHNHEYIVCVHANTSYCLFSLFTLHSKTSMSYLRFLRLC